MLYSGSASPQLTGVCMNQKGRVSDDEIRAACDHMLRAGDASAAKVQQMLGGGSTARVSTILAERRQQLAEERRIKRSEVNGEALTEVDLSPRVSKAGHTGPCGIATSDAEIRGTEDAQMGEGEEPVGEPRELPMPLDLTRTDSPYLLGRLFAVVEKTQRDTLGSELNQTTRGLGYYAASTKPGFVVPLLLDRYQDLKPELESGLRRNRDEMVEEIMGRLTDVPRRLVRNDRATFHIGYFHQSAAFR